MLELSFDGMNVYIYIYIIKHKHGVNEEIFGIKWKALVKEDNFIHGITNTLTKDQTWQKA